LARGSAAAAAPARRAGRIEDAAALRDALLIKPRGMLTSARCDAWRCASTESFPAESEALDAWIGDAIDSELIPIMRFASVLRRATL
jgi:hypothetical protein